MIVALDVEGFGDRQRTRQHQIIVRNGLYRALRAAFSAVGLAWEDCYHEDRGDGLFLLLPADVPKKAVVAPLPREFAAALREHNAVVAPQARIRVRLALHAGEIQHDAFGVTGTALTTAFRLLDAAAVRAALAASPGVLAVVASDWLYDDVVRHEPAADPAAYRKVRVAVKELRTHAWVGRPDYPYRPEVSSTRAARTSITCLAGKPRRRAS